MCFFACRQSVINLCGVFGVSPFPTIRCVCELCCAVLCSACHWQVYCYNFQLLNALNAFQLCLLDKCWSFDGFCSVSHACHCCMYKIMKRTSGDNVNFAHFHLDRQLNTYLVKTILYIYSDIYFHVSVRFSSSFSCFSIAAFAVAVIVGLHCCYWLSNAFVHSDVIAVFAKKTNFSCICYELKDQLFRFLFVRYLVAQCRRFDYKI